MKHIAIAGLFIAMAATTASAQVNAGEQKPEATLPFNMVQVTTLSLPWKIAFLPDGRMLITEKTGTMQIVTQQGAKTPVTGVPPVLWRGQGGLLGVYLSPHYATDHNVYLTYSEPGEPSGSSLALARAQLKIGADTASLENLQVIWRDGERGEGGQFGGEVTFSPDSKYLYLSSGDRQRMTPAQDPNQPLGKILRLTLDGKPAPGNPMAGKLGSATVPVIDPPSDTEAAKTAPVVRTYTFPGPNLTPSETWASGIRTPYGLAFAPDGRLWELEHGPRGGDELNLIEPRQKLRLAARLLWPELQRRTHRQPGNPHRPHSARHLLGSRHRTRQPRLLQRSNVLAVEWLGSRQRASPRNPSPASPSTKKVEQRLSNAGTWVAEYAT